MEAAARAFEDWEFRVLERESGIDEEDESAVDKEKEGEKEREMDKEISCQQHAVNTAQVNNVTYRRNLTAASDVLHSFVAFLHVIWFKSVYNTCTLVVIDCHTNFHSIPTYVSDLNVA